MPRGHFAKIIRNNNLVRGTNTNNLQRDTDAYRSTEIHRHIMLVTLYTQTQNAHRHGHIRDTPSTHTHAGPN